MGTRREVLVGSTMAALVTGMTAQKAMATPVAVGLVCLSVGAPPERDVNFHIDFDLSKGRWSEGENGSTSLVFKSKSGPYLVLPEGTYLKTDGGQSAGLLQGFAPAKANQNDQRSDGKAMETGRIFQWTVAIVTN